MSDIKNTIKLLRFPFSVFLLPISLFSFFYIHPGINMQVFLVLIIWHVLVFPSSNGYNSFHDRDDGPIGGLASPPKATKYLFYIANTFDAVAVLLSLLINIYFALFVLGYIVASRLYSNRSIRLKKFPIIGFLVVFVFQGAWVFCANVFAFSNAALLSNPSVICAAVASSFFIGTIYPITQIYQHESDRKDGVKTISMLLGIKGTFIFAALNFLMATGFIYLSFQERGLNKFWLFNIIMLPSTLYFLLWANRSFKDRSHINFRNTMTMLMISSLLTNLYFFIILFN